METFTLSIPTPQAFRIIGDKSPDTQLVSPEEVASALDARLPQAGETGLLVEAGIRHWYTPATEFSLHAWTKSKLLFRSLHHRFGTKTLLLAALIFSSLMLTFGLTVAYFNAAPSTASTVVDAKAASVSEPLTTFLTVPRRSNASAQEWLARAQAALVLADSFEALISLEKAIALDAAVAQKPQYLETVLRTFAAAQPQRSAKLIESLDKSTLTLSTLQQYARDANPRIRRAAAEKLKAFSVPVADEIGVLLLDALQTEKCEERKALFAKLLTRPEKDERIAAAQQFWDKKDPKCAAAATKTAPK